jgi:hypothetical protein
MKKALTALAATLTVVVLLTASSCDEKGLGDAPVGKQDDRPAYIVNFPDTFANVAIKCANGLGIISTTREAPVQLVPDAVFCDGDEVRDEYKELG